MRKSLSTARREDDDPEHMSNAIYKLAGQLKDGPAKDKLVIGELLGGYKGLVQGSLRP
jgi:hypothetical protein